MTPSPVVTALGVAAFVVLAGWLVRTERRRARELAQLLSTMGFRAVPGPDPGHAEALLALHRRGTDRQRRLDFRKVFRRDAPGGALYVFDVYREAGKKSGPVASSAVGLVRAGAGLPSLEVYSSAELGIAGGALARGLGHGQELRLDGDAHGLIVLSTAEGGEAAVRAALGPAVRQALAGARFAVLAAEGDALALQGNPFSAANRGDTAGALRRLVEAAPRLFDALGGGR
jgi:hypothetical protein